MAVFEKARAMCTQLESLADLQKMADEQTAFMQTAVPGLSRDRESQGKATRTLLEESAQKNAAIALWIEAHVICAARAQKAPAAYFDRKAVRVELERLEALAFQGWAPIDNAWHKVFSSPEELVKGGKILGILMEAYGIEGYAAPTLSASKIMTMSEQGMALIDSMRMREDGIDPAQFAPRASKR